MGSESAWIFTAKLAEHCVHLTDPMLRSRSISHVTLLSAKQWREVLRS